MLQIITNLKIFINPNSISASKSIILPVWLFFRQRKLPAPTLWKPSVVLQTSEHLFELELQLVWSNPSCKTSTPAALQFVGWSTNENLFASLKPQSNASDVIFIIGWFFWVDFRKFSDGSNSVKFWTSYTKPIEWQISGVLDLFKFFYTALK